jgi:hypothetical protein
MDRRQEEQAAANRYFANLEETMKAPTAEKPTAESDPFEGLKPGRIVHYHPRAHEARNASPGPWAAIVTLVGEAGLITLNVQLPTPVMIGTDPVARIEKVPYSEEKAEGCWSWMFEGQGGRYKS